MSVDPRHSHTQSGVKPKKEARILFFFLLTVLVLCGGIPATKAVTFATAARSADFKVVKLHALPGVPQTYCKISSARNVAGRIIVVKKKSVFERYNPRDLARLTKSKQGQKILAACAKKKFVNSNENLVAILPTAVPNAIPTVTATAVPPDLCSDGIDNDGDGLIDSDDPKCWRVASRSETLSATPHKVLALTWDDSAGAPANFVGMIRLTTWQINDIDFYKSELAKRPSGQRSLLLQYSDLFEIMTNDPDDYCTGKNGAPNYACLFWDHGVDRLAATLDTFFSKLHQSGAQLDYIVLDFEGGLGIWNLNLWDATSFGNYFDPVTRDPRWLPVKSSLQAVAFPDVTMPFNILDPGWDGRSYQQWNAVMADHIAGYLNNAIFAPARKYFPNVSGSNFGSRECDSAYQLPEFNGHIECQFNSTQSVGGQQNVVLYGGLSNIQWLQWRDIHGYPLTSYSALRFDLNWVKSAKLSGTKPLSAWVAYREFATLYHTKDSMSEVVEQAMSAGVQHLLVWNPRPWDPSQNPADWSSPASDAELSAAISEFEALTEGYSIQYNVTEMEPWNTNFLSSCMTLEGAGQLCRITADPQCASSLNFTETDDGTTVTACGQTKFFAGVRVWSGHSVAPLGTWLVPKTAI